MDLALNIDYFEKSIGMVEAAQTVKNAGFTYLDYSPKFQDFAWDVFEKELTILHDHGLKVYQSHAPFNRYGQFASKEEWYRLLETSLDTAVEAEARYLVVHGDEFDAQKCRTPQDILLYNYDLFAPIVEKAVKKGINIAFENVFQDDLPIPRYGSCAEDLAALIDRFACPQVCCCWDFGHGSVAYPKGQQDAIRTVGNRIRCTHVHDNYLETDMHLVPMLGKINWSTCMKALKETALVEVLSFELVYGSVTPGTAQPLADLLYATGNAMI